jgi:hypothetical protein
MSSAPQIRVEQRSPVRGGIVIPNALMRLRLRLRLQGA